MGARAVAAGLPPVPPPPPLVVAAPTVPPVSSPDGGAVVVDLPPAAPTTGGIAPIVTVYDPPSGSTFPVGDTPVSVTVTDAVGATDDTSVVVTVVPPVVPVVTTGADWADLIWDATPGATGYRLLYGTAPAVYPDALDVGLVLTARVNGLTAGTLYYFVVEALNAFGTSTVSNEVSATV